MAGNHLSRKMVSWIWCVKLWTGRSFK